MPGICGIMRKEFNKEDKNRIKTMVKSLMHEKFYVSGTYYNEKMSACLGWVCHKDSFSDCLPVWNEKKDICLFFSGENFIDDWDLLNLKAKGHDFNKAKASYLVHIYEEIGINFLEKLNGCLSGILVDLREEKIILFNDRFGSDRIYYHENENAFYFSSEAKSLLKILPDLRQLNIESLGEFFSCSCTLENKTLFSKISLIPGGSMWTFHPQSQVKKEVYFTKDHWENQPVLKIKEYYDELKATFSRILPRYFSGPQRVGMSLTGGIDTRMIMAWAPCPPFKVPCYTFNGMYRDCSDAKIAKKVADLCQQWHENIRMNRKFFAEFPGLAKRAVYYTDGTMDVSGSVELYVNRTARGIAPIRLTGNYGDQVIRGVMGFKPRSLCENIFDLDFVRHVNAGAIKYNKIKQNSSLSFFLFKLVPWHHYGRLAIEKTQLTLRSPFLDNDLVALSFQAPPEMVGSIETSVRLIAEGNKILSKIATDRGILFRPIPIFNKLRRLYQDLTVKAEYVYDYGMPEWLARVDHFLRPLHLERHFLGRHKFYHFRVWYRDELAKYVRGVLLDTRTINRPYLNGKFLEEMVNSHTNGERNYTQEIHWLLTSELIQRNLIETG